MKKLLVVLLVLVAGSVRGADQKVSAMPTNSAPASSDVVLSVDVSDTSQAASGTNKKLTLTTLGAFYEGSLNLQNFQGQVTDTQVPDTITITGPITNLSLVTPNVTGAITFEDNVRQTFNPGVATPGLNVGGYTGDPTTPSNGDVWYDSTGNLLRARINGANVSLGAATGDVTAASAFGTDNRIIRSDGAVKGVQTTGITVDDSNNVTGIATLGVTTTNSTNFSILDAVDQSHGLSFIVSSNLTAAKTFTYTGPYNFTMTLTGDTSVTFPTSGTLATLADIGSSGGADSLTATHASPSTTTPLSPTWTSGEHDIFYGATGTINLPAAAGYVGKRALVYNTGAFTITIDPNGSEIVVREGTVQTAGQSMTLSSGAGNYVELLCDGARWVTLDKVGTLAAGSAGFTPPTGTFAWYQADALVLSNNDPVSSWTDSSASGNTATQATGGAQPIYLTTLQNGLPGVRFDGTNDYMASATFGAAETQPNTVHMVVAAKNVAVNQYITDGNTANRQMVMFSSILIGISGYAGSTMNGTGGALNTTTAHQITVVFNGASSTIHIDGVAQGTGDVGAGSMGAVTLGATGDLGGFGQVDIFEVLWSPGGRDTATEAYLKTKWGTP